MPTNKHVLSPGPDDEVSLPLQLALLEVLRLKCHRWLLEDAEVVDSLRMAIVHLNHTHDISLGEGAVPASFYRLLAHPDQPFRHVVRLPADASL